MLKIALKLLCPLITIHTLSDDTFSQRHELQGSLWILPKALHRSVALMRLEQPNMTPETTLRFPATTSVVAEKHGGRELPLIIDLCCGLGGISLAARQLGMRIAAGVDLTSEALRTFACNFPEADAIETTVAGKRAVECCRFALARRKLANEPLVVVSGPPCQGFSAAGTRDPKDRRNNVLLAVARAIVALEPACALVENVQTLLSKKHAGRVGQFEANLVEAGYHVMPVQLNAQDYGVAQRRSRAFFLITKVQLDVTAVSRRFEILKRQQVSSSQALAGLPDAEPRGIRYNDEDEDAARYPNHLAMRHSAAVREKIAAIAPGTGPMSYRKLHPERPANTLFSGHRAPPAHFQFPRSITVREAARLQGFPDDFRVYGCFANQMMQVTNAVPPPLARVVLSVLIEFAGVPLPCHV